MTMSNKINWKWVGVGVALAMVISVSLFVITKETFGTFYLPAFLALFGFVIMGLVIGYFSDGVVIREAAIAGAVSICFTVAIWYFVFDYYPPTGQLILAPVLGFILGLVGSWVGEEMQGSLKEVDEAISFFLYPGWIAAGAVFIYILNNLLMFLVAPIFNYSDTAVLVSYAISFSIASFFIGFKSPGYVVVEAVLAGMFAVAISECVQYLNLFLRGSDYMPSFGYVLTNLGYAVLFSFVGAFIGERFQQKK